MHRLYGFDENYKYKEHKDDDFWRQSEKEIMESKGYLQIFDAGMKKYVWENKERNESNGAKFCKFTRTYCCWFTS